MGACTRGDLGDAERLLCDRADPCHRGEFGATPLSRAAEQGHVGLVSMLLSHGGSHDMQDDNGDTALLCACRMGHAGVARVLLAAGADPGVSNMQGNNSLDAALEAPRLYLLWLHLLWLHILRLAEARDPRSLRTLTLHPHPHRTPCPPRPSPLAAQARNLLGRPEVSELLLGHRRGDNPLEASPPRKHQC